MTTLHMDTNSVNSSAQQMKQTIERMKEQTQNIISSAQSMNWVGPSRDEFISESQYAIQAISSHLDTGLILASRAEREADEWENTASNLAGAYGGIFNGIKGISLPASIPIMAFAASSFGAMSGVSVLGAATTINEISAAGGKPSNIATYTAQYQAMRWSDKFVEQRRLDTEIASHAGTLPPNAMDNLKKLDADIAVVERQLAEAQAKRDAAYAKSKGLFNQVIPDFPLKSDKEDGLPWRVKADDYEDQVAEYDRQLAGLQQQKRDLLSARNSIQSNVDKLEQLNSQKAALGGVISQGITDDGPSEKYPYFPGTDASNCTKYASSRRDVPCSGDAHKWNEQAKVAGHDVGNTPVKGSVIVFEPDPKGVVSHKIHGHVAIVDGVKNLGDGKYEVNISEGGWNGGKEVNHRTIEVDASAKSSSYNGISTSYIY